jgi:hypothetical protein
LLFFCSFFGTFVELYVNAAYIHRRLNSPWYPPVEQHGLGIQV